MKVHMGIDIEAPAETVWPYLVEPDKAMQWYDMLKVFEWSGDERGPGAAFYWEEEVRGKTYSNHFRTTAWEPNRVFGFEMTKGNFFAAYTERWAIEPTPVGCRFSFDDEMVFPYGPWGKVMGWFGERMGRASAQQVLANIKRLSEQDLVPDQP